MNWQLIISYSLNSSSRQCVDTEWPKLRMNADEIDFERLLKLCRVVFDCMEQQQKFQLRIIGELHDACMTLRERQLV